MTEDAGTTPVAKDDEGATTEEQSEGRGGKSPYQFTQEDVNKMTGRARDEAKAVKEREFSAELGIPLEEAKEIISRQREAEEKNRTESEKAMKRAEKAEGKVTELSGFKERAERAEGALEGYAETLREGLPASLIAVLDGKDVVDQLEWLTENRDEYLAKPASKAPEPRRAPDTSQAPANGTDLKGRDRLRHVFGAKYG